MWSCQCQWLINGTPAISSNNPPAGKAPQMSLNHGYLRNVGQMKTNENIDPQFSHRHCLKIVMAALLTLSKARSQFQQLLGYWICEFISAAKKMPTPKSQGLNLLTYWAGIMSLSQKPPGLPGLPLWRWLLEFETKMAGVHRDHWARHQFQCYCRSMRCEIDERISKKAHVARLRLKHEPLLFCAGMETFGPWSHVCSSSSHCGPFSMVYSMIQ